MGARAKQKSVHEIARDQGGADQEVWAAVFSREKRPGVPVRGAPVMQCRQNTLMPFSLISRILCLAKSSNG